MAQPANHSIIILYVTLDSPVGVEYVERGIETDYGVTNKQGSNERSNDVTQTQQQKSRVAYGNSHLVCLG